MNHSYQHNKNAEVNYLKDLINKFGNKNQRADDAIKELYARYKILEKQRSSNLARTEQNTDGYYNLCTTIHYLLYKGILTNAGQFRKISDPDGGNVYFGGISCKTMKNKFTGTDPELIESELKVAFAILFNSKYKTVENSIRFYAEFVAIHPFYDANGRIGRYIVDTFLQSHNYYVNWRSLNQRHGKFLRKLNYCHSVRARAKEFLSSNNPDSIYYPQQKVYWQSVREKYINYLLKFEVVQINIELWRSSDFRQHRYQFKT